jgi:chromosome segregation ATPase
MDTEVRTIEQVDQEVQEIQAASEGLVKERESLDAELLGSTNEGALLEAALSGKSLKSSAKVRKTEDRLGEIEDMLTALTNRLARLHLERVGLREAELQEELAVAGEKVMNLREVEEKARQKRQHAENQVAFRNQETYSLREQRRDLENQLWENDPSYLEEALAERERRIEEHTMTPEQVAAYRRQLVVAAGGTPVDNAEDLEAVRREAAKQGSGVFVIG